MTPNIPEAECLCGISIESTDGMLQAARQIAGQIPGAVLVKGGHLTDTADDLLYHDGQAHWYHAPRVNNPNTHGTGCTLSSAIACQLAFGLPLPEAVRLAKKYITGALSSGLNLGKGSGPLNHCFAIGEGR